MSDKTRNRSKARVARASRGSKQQARTIAYALARPLRGLRRGFEVGERLGHLFPVPALRETVENLAEIVQKRRPEGPKSAPGPSWGLSLVSWGSFGASWGSFWVSWCSLWASWGAPGALPALSGASGDPLGASKIAPGGPPGGLPRKSLIFEAIWDPFWLPFWIPRTSKI